MRPTSLVFLAAALAMGAATLPAQADVHQLGDVNVSAAQYTHVSWSRFEGPVLRLRFTAANDTVDCEHIIVTYRDGTSHDVFSGILAENSTETITFPEGDSRIRNVDFACKARSVDGARIALSAVSEGLWPAAADDDTARPAHVRTEAATITDGR
jgi:hypothetical protein